MNQDERKTVLQNIGIDSSATITFPRIRELRGKYGLSYDAMAQLIGAKSHQTFIKRLNEGNFTIDEMKMLTNHFEDLGEDVSVFSLFFDWLSTYVKS